MKISEVNSTEKAKRKIKKIAKNNNLDYELVHAIFSFNWNYDGREGNWVANLEIDDDYNERVDFICEKLGLTRDKTYSKSEVVDLVIDKLKNIDSTEVFNDFLSGSVSKNNCNISKYATYHYLNNFSKEKLESLIWKNRELDSENIIWRVFCKIFRAGSVDRYNLDYVFADLVIDLPFENSDKKQTDTANDWTKQFIEKIDETMKLSDLVKALKGFCKGDKYYLQTILEALSYSRILQVKNHSVKDIFIPDYRDKLSSHFMSNEWTYPLRFWNGR